MKNAIITALLAMVPSHLGHEYLPEKVYTNSAFSALLHTCLTGGHASIWFNDKPAAYVSCHQIPFPSRFPR